MDRHSSLTLAAVIALCGFLLVAVATSAREQRQAAEPRRQELIGLIDDRRKLVDQLDEEVARLRAELIRVQEEVAQRGSIDRAAATAAALLSQQAGTTPMRGPGLQVRLSDSEREPPSPGEAGAYRIHDSDVQLTVNALFAAGAEAVAVNDSRIVATTPIRAAGDTIVVNFRPLNPPYRLEAIGADRARFEQSEIARRFKRWTKLFGLGFTVKPSTSLTVPGYSGRVVISNAEPATVG